MCEKQCCGSETIYSGSGSDLGKVSDPDPDPDPDPYSDPDPYHIWHSIYIKKFCTRSCLFILEAALLPRELLPHFLIM